MKEKHTPEVVQKWRKDDAFFEVQNAEIIPYKEVEGPVKRQVEMPDLPIRPILKMLAMAFGIIFIVGVFIYLVSAVVTFVGSAIMAIGKYEIVGFLVFLIFVTVAYMMFNVIKNDRRRNQYLSDYETYIPRTKTKKTSCSGTTIIVNNIIKR